MPREGSHRLLGKFSFSIPGNGFESKSYIIVQDDHWNPAIMPAFQEEG